MNTLTKVFVVLLVIFSIAFTMMTVQFSAGIPNWKNEAEKWKTTAQMTDTYSRNIIAAKVAEAAKAAADRQDLEKEKSDLARQAKEDKDKLEEAKARLAKIEAESAAKDATLKQLTAELSIAQAGAEKAREHRNQLEQTNLDLQKRNADLNNAYNEKVATLIVMEQQSRQQEQAIHLLKSERDKLLKKFNLQTTALEEQTVTRPTDKIRAATPAKVAPMIGKIREIREDYAAMSIGSDDGVESGMVFIIYNDQGYLGDLIVGDVTPKSAAGKLKNLVGQIRIGDLVAEESSYLAMN